MCRLAVVCVRSVLRNLLLTRNRSLSIYDHLHYLMGQPISACVDMMAPPKKPRVLPKWKPIDLKR